MALANEVAVEPVGLIDYFDVHPGVFKAWKQHVRSLKRQARVLAAPPARFTRPNLARPRPTGRTPRSRRTARACRSRSSPSRTRDDSEPSSGASR